MAAIGDDALEDMFVREVKGLRFQLLKKYEERCCLFFEYNAHLATQARGGRCILLHSPGFFAFCVHIRATTQ